ncbi:MAG: ABC transporter ATP-binding protein [Candidatus Cloacimonas sp.]|jgi:energy-coupling factor transport system ATP-binding protein|nr:ABC transporter ATP-binding protein [Candidatus Cloacimonas sp.]
MLKIVELCLNYADLPVLSGFNLELEPGTIGVLTGGNGCGKSSLLAAISGVVPEHIEAAVSGSIYLHDIDLRQLPLREKYHHLWHALSAEDSQFFFPTCEAELSFALENMGVPALEIRTRINCAAAYFGLSEKLLSSPQALSGGQQKLLLCAVGMALSPKLYLLDEPASGLSGCSLQLFCRWLGELKAQGKIVLVAEHHPAVIAMADKVITLQKVHD